MKKILHIMASPRDGRSHSRKLANYFIDKLMGVYPNIQLEELDLSLAELPAFGKPGATAKYKIGQAATLSPEEREQWEKAKSIWLHFQAADAYVFSIPMWNFNLPYEMKHYIDLITQPGWTFSVNENGYEGLLKGKKIFVAFATGGNYDEPDAAPFDFLRPYIRFWCQFNGLEMYEVTNHSTNLKVDHEEVFRECQAKVDEILKISNPA